MLNDFEGPSIETSVGVNSPLGGGGVSFGGTSPQVEYDLMDTFRNIGTDGYTTGTVSSGLNALLFQAFLPQVLEKLLVIRLIKDFKSQIL